MNNPLVSINLVVLNGEKYIKNCLNSVLNQNYENIEVIIFDNGSTDKTKEIVKKEFPRFRLIENNKNYYVGSAWNRCIKITNAKYVMGLCVDVIMDKNFIKNAVNIMESHPNAGVLQAKIYRLIEEKPSNIIDTAGFKIFKSRRIINRGHGEIDSGQFDNFEEIFSYEGAAPFWRRQALEESAIFDQYHDEDFTWYADDVDLGWRLRLFGWKSYFAPNVIAYHVRSTTKRLSDGYLDFIKMRKTLPAKKKMLDWRNLHLTFIKNDFTISAFKDFFPYFKREIMLFIYIIFFEPYTLFAIPQILIMLPKTIKKRCYIMKNKKATRQEMEKWFV